MNENILFKSREEKEATERVLALVRTKRIARKTDELISEAITYASNIDKILSRNNLNKRYLDRIGSLENLEIITLDEELEEIEDFRVKEVIEDLIKRINTRINLIKSNEELAKELKETYKVNEDSIIDDINTARLNISDFIGEDKEEIAE